jgi:hypothetical protein
MKKIDIENELHVGHPDYSEYWNGCLADGLKPFFRKYSLCGALEAARIPCWIAPRDVVPARSYSGEITRAINNSRVMVLIFSEHSNVSAAVLSEVELAANARIHILNFRVDDSPLGDDLRFYLQRLHWFDALTPPTEQHHALLVQMIQRLLAPSSTPKEEELPPPPPPPPRKVVPRKPGGLRATKFPLLRIVWLVALVAGAAVAIWSWIDGGPWSKKSMKVDLASFTNCSIEWLRNVPVGDRKFAGVPFKIIAGPRAAVCSATAGRPTWPTRFSFALGAQRGVRRVHAMLTGSWVDQEPSGKIGTLKVVYGDGPSRDVDLVTGRTIQEAWRPERALFDGAAPVQVHGVQWQTVYYEEQSRDGEKAFATLDVLTVDVDPALAIDRIELERSSERAGFALVALTLER